ncbi:MAG: ABC transporter [Planctomycetes bacterium]|jgi:lipopolysaccharide transport system permease protein|nr:ABC transporter [Planctomycetota bacterium]MDP6410295.1 ABC transporter permease [Planctomycetota bacterium]
MSFLTVSKTPSRRLLHARDLLFELVVRDMKLRYKRSFLGILWTLVNPLMQLFVYDFVFRVLFQVKTPNYTAYLFIGITSWNWFQTAVLEATGAILSNPDLIRQPGFPTAILPNVTVGSHLVHFLITLPILFGLVLYNSIPLTAAVLWLPVVILIQYLLTLGFALIGACMHVRFRDTQYLLSVFLMLAFFLTPVLYELSMVPERYHRYYRMNPMTHMVDAYRAILLRGESPDLNTMVLLAGGGAVLLGLAYSLFHRASANFVEEL